MSFDNYSNNVYHSGYISNIFAIISGNWKVMISGIRNILFQTSLGFKI